MDDALERRFAPLSNSAPTGRLSGYAAKFNSPATIAGEFIERIAPGAFKRSLAEEDVLALLSHDYGRVIGRKSSGTLRIGEDALGLWVEIDPPNSPDGWTARELIGRRDLSGMSFGFRVRKEAWEDLGDLPVRTLLDVDLYEVSVVALPAYDDTSVVLKGEDGTRRSTVLRLSVAKVEAAMKARGLV